MASENAAQLLVAVAGEAYVSEDAEPRDTWWGSEDYRSSSSAAFTTGAGPRHLSSDGVALLEEVVAILTRTPGLSARWHLNDLWNYVVSLLGAVCDADVEERLALATRGISRIRSAGSTIVVEGIANASWSGPPSAFGRLLLGPCGEEFAALVATAFQLKPEAVARFTSVMEYESGWPDGTVLIAHTSDTLGSLAVERCDAAIEQLVSLLLLFHDQSDGLKFPSPSYRPGPWGLTMDRNFFTQHDEDPHMTTYGSTAVSFSHFGTHTGHRWIGTEPLDLGELARSCHATVVERALSGSDAVSSRLRVAARWFHKSCWSSSEDDACLSLGVAMEALLTGGGNLSTATKKHLFQMLEPDASLRPDRGKAFSDFYAVRSAVAHGASSRRLGKLGGLEWMRGQVAWAARKLARFGESGRVCESETDLQGELEHLRLGISVWAREDATDSDEGQE